MIAWDLSGWLDLVIGVFVVLCAVGLIKNDRSDPS